MCAAAAVDADLPSKSSRCNRAYAARAGAKMLAPVLLRIDDVAATIRDGLVLLNRVSQRFIAGRSRP